MQLAQPLLRSLSLALALLARARDAPAAICDGPLESLAVSRSGARLAVAVDHRVYTSDDRGARWSLRATLDDHPIHELWIDDDGTLATRQESARHRLSIFAPDGAMRAQRDTTADSKVAMAHGIVAIAAPDALHLSRDAGRTFVAAPLPVDRTLRALGPRATDVFIEPDRVVRLLRAISSDEDDVAHGWSSAVIACRSVATHERCVLRALRRDERFNDRAAILVPGGGLLAHDSTPTLFRYRDERGPWAPLAPSPRGALDGLARSGRGLWLQWDDGALWAIERGVARTAASELPSRDARVAASDDGALWALTGRALYRRDPSRWSEVLRCPAR